jgi:hypothetical protein
VGVETTRRKPGTEISFLLNNNYPWIPSHRPAVSRSMTTDNPQLYFYSLV